MAWTPYQVVLAVLLVVTGSINTIVTKWADRMEAPGSDGVVRPFNHPFLQAVAMFVGEMMCMLVFEILSCYFRMKQRPPETVSLLRGATGYNPFVLFPPSLCDMIATSTMYIGLNLTYASSFQMLRGAVIVFVAIFSRIFLRRVLDLQKWIGILFVIAGLVIVGLSDVIGSSSGESHSTSDLILGDVLIIVAQVIVAIQMVWEEKYVSGLDIPSLQAVGWEGTFGVVVMGLLLIPFYYIHVPPPFSDNAHSVLEDAPDAFSQMGNNNLIIVGIIGTIISIAFFNFAGISVTKEISATTRMVLDSLRTLIIWLFSLGVQWQPFHYLQVIGFIVLLIGMCLYNDVFIMQSINKVRSYISRRRGYQSENSISSQPADKIEE